MRKANETGYIEITGVVLLIFVSSVLACALLYYDALRRYGHRSLERGEIDRAARNIALTVLEDVSSFLEEPYDSNNSDAFARLIDRYAQYSLEFEDVSSGLNVAFLPEGEFAERLPAAVFVPGKAEEFVKAIQRGELPRSIDDLREFVREEALEWCVVYGWIHRITPVSPGLRYIARLYGTENRGKLFPLINEIPLVNVNFAPREAIRYYLTDPKYAIERSEEKAKSLCDLAEVGVVDTETLRSVLETERTNALYSVLGVKTAFWRATYRVRGKSYRCVLCALPSRENASEIERYEMISWGMTDE